MFFLLESGGEGWSFKSVLKMKLYRVLKSSITWALEVVELLLVAI